jgi:hypothetical protein
MKNRKNPFSKPEVTWIRAKASAMGGRLVLANDDLVETLFEDEKTAEKFHQVLEDARFEELPSLQGLEVHSVYDRELDKVVDVSVTAYGSNPPPLKESDYSIWTMVIIGAVALSAYIYYKSYSK